MTKKALLAVTFALLPLGALAQDEQLPTLGKLAVVPFAALSGDVPLRAGQKAAGMLSTELRNTERMQLLDLKRTAGQEPFTEGLEKARSLVAEAVRQRGAKKFRLAEEALTRALGELKTSAVGLAQIDELVDAWALLSAVQYNTGRDEEGKKSLVTALALAPSRELPLAKTSALFSKVVEAERKALQQAPKGSLLVESTPAGAAVFIDAVALGATPLLVKEVPPGQHLWKVALPSGEVAGGLVEVTGGKQAKVSAQTTAKDAESRMLFTLSQNKLDQELLAAAKEHAAASGAELLVFGALSRQGKGLALDAFLYSAAGGELRRLPRALFDTELLSAGMEFFSMAGQLAQHGAKVGQAVKLPSAVSGTPISSSDKISEARYGDKQDKEGSIEPETIEPAKDDGKRTPLAPNKVRSPLKKK